MKKVLLILFSILIFTAFTACGNVQKSESTGAGESVSSDASVSSNETSSDADSSDDITEGTAKIRLTFEGGEAILVLEDSAATQDLLAQLPLTQEFEDFNSIEKICRLQEKLSTNDITAGVDPAVADVTLYVPWNTLVFYYEDYGYNDDLIPIGHVESGMDQLAAMGERFTVTMERLDETKDVKQNETTNITMTSGNTVITATLNNSETTKAFLATLPRTLTMNNYADREYYARIDALPENGELISDFENGDVTYYPAGPSFAVFFAKADSSNQSGLIRMGKVTSDLSDFASLSETAEILIEVAE